MPVASCKVVCPTTDQCTHYAMNFVNEKKWNKLPNNLRRKFRELRDSNLNLDAANFWMFSAHSNSVVNSPRLFNGSKSGSLKRQHGNTVFLNMATFYPVAPQWITNTHKHTCNVEMILHASVFTEIHTHIWNGMDFTVEICIQCMQTSAPSITRHLPTYSNIVHVLFPLNSARKVTLSLSSWIGVKY